MKKKFYYGIALLVSIAIVSTYVAKQEAKLPQLLKANIEALAADEGGGEGYFPCFSDEDYTCYFIAKDGEGFSHSCSVPRFKHI